ncbi:uncharacterized protein [Apostichopus japonicus]|uniref:uncharacterized protein isoform X2 n=1 Tax=Stichopus japonicus TaxID=307972 RepID=UPI003AB8715F
MELTLSFLNVGQLLTILHSVAFSLASNVSINIEVSAAGLVDGELHAVSTPEGSTKDIHSSYPPHVPLSHSISLPGEVSPVLHSKLTTSSAIKKLTGSPYLRDNSKTIYKLNVSAFYSASSYQSYHSFTKSVLSPTPVNQAFPDSTSEPVTMVTIRPTSTIGGNLYTIAITSSFPSMTFLPSNSLAITSSNAGIVPTVILTSHSTSQVPPIQTSKLNSHPSTTLEPSFISRTSQSYATPKLPSTVTTSSTTSEEINAMSSSTSPPGTATSAVTVDNTTSAVPVDNTTSAVTVDNTTSAVTVDNTTSAVTVDNTTSAVTVDNTTSAVTVGNTTSAVPVDNKTSAVTVDNTTSAVTVDNTTSAVTVDNTTSAVTVDNTTSAVPVDNTTSAVTVDNTTSAVTVDNTTSAVTVDNTTSAVTVDNTTSAVTVDNSTFAAPLSSTTMSSPVEKVSTNNPTLDKSFSTREYWVMMELSTPLDMDIQDGGFLKELELSLALSYSKGKEIEVEKDAEVKQLLQNLNPEEDILLSRRRKRRRRKRASTIDGHTAQIIDLSRNVEIASSSELVFYIMSGGVNIPAVTCATTFSELSVQELTLLLGVVVLTPVSSYDAVPTTASPAADSNLVILLSIFIPLVILSSCMCCCCMFCVMCGPKKKENERTMAPDTFRMLEFKQKFPYKPYPSNLTPRDFKEQPSDDDVALGTEINLGGDLIEVDPTPRVYPDGDNNFNLESFQLPKTIPKTNRGLEPSVTEPPVSSSQNELLDKPNHNRNVSDSEATMRNLPHLQPSSRSNSEYKKAQREISKILEPGNRSKPRKKRKKQEEQSSSQLTNEDEKFSRGPTKISSDDTSETMSETKQRVHALIEEAFSLVNFSRAPPTTNVTHLNSQNDEKDDTDEEQKTISEARHAADLLKGKKKEFGMQTMQAEEQRQVLIVPVNVPPTDGTSIIWSPYSARDELQRISPTREPASLPGGIGSSLLRDESIIKLPATASRPSFPDGAEYSASFLGHQPPLNHSTQSHEYSALDTNNALYSPRGYHTADFVQIKDGKDTSDRGGSRNYENSQKYSQKYGNLSYLTELETERTQRSAGFYDELDVTANFRYGQKPYSSTLLESIKAELKNTTRRGGDGQ